MTAPKAEALARDLMVALFTKWPEHGRKRMRDMVEEALPAIIHAAHAEGRAAGLPTVEELAKALHLRGIACSPFRGSVVVSPSGASPLERVVLSCEPGYHRPAAEALTTALAQQRETGA